MATPDEVPTDIPDSPAGNGTAPPQIAPTTALRCDCCGRRPMLIPEISIQLKSTMGPVAMDQTQQMFRIPILCDECLGAWLLNLRRSMAIIQPETDLTSFRRLELPKGAITA